MTEPRALTFASSLIPDAAAAATLSVGSPVTKIDSLRRRLLVSMSVRAVT
jgi:hypothetical protein